MISLVQIRCPHCGATGRMVLPPVGTILIGPCPQCQEMVAIFCGQALALDTEVIKNGSNPEKEAHLMAVLTEFIENQVGDMIHRSFEGEVHTDQDLDTPRIDGEDSPDPQWPPENSPEEWVSEISAEELSHFRETELNLIDDPHYFRAIFG